MQSQNDKIQLAAELKKKKYIDNYIERWLKLETLDVPHVECEGCGYVSNASIHQHLIPSEFGLNSNSNRIIHLCANCYYELRALINKHNTEMVPEKISQMCEEAFEELKEKKKYYRDVYKNLEGVKI